MATVLQDFDQESYIADLIEGVAPEWRSEFQRFVETGEAQEAFLNYLDKDMAAQEAVEKAFNRQAIQFERLAAELKKRQQPKVFESPTSVERSSTPTKLAAVMEVAMQTPKEQREEVVQMSTAELAESMPLEERKVLKEVARSLESNLSKLADATHS